MSSRQNFEIFLYKHKLNTKTLIDILPQLSSKTIDCIMRDLDVLTEKQLSDDIYIFTDGGCFKNGKVDSKAGYSVFFTDDEDSPLYEFNTTRLVVKDPTNNKAELSAIRYTFRTISENSNFFKNKNVIICTDSMYSINCVDKWSSGWIKNNWKNAKGEDVKNKEIIKDILQLKQDLTKNNISTKFQHVFSHTQEPQDKNSLQHFLWYGNKRVDENIKKILNI
jgi:ribonuclease HI